MGIEPHRCALSLHISVDIGHVQQQFTFMIRTFRSKPLRRFAEKGDASRLPVQNADRVRRILVRLDVVKEPGDMDLPGWFFHPLKGVARYSVRVTGNWRITFGWDGTDAIDVDMEDHH